MRHEPQSIPERRTSRRSYDDILPPFDVINRLFDEEKATEAIQHFVQEGYPEIRQLQQLLKSRKIPVHGDYALMAGHRLVIAADLSGEFAEVLLRLVSSGALKLNPIFDWHDAPVEDRLCTVRLPLPGRPLPIAHQMPRGFTIKQRFRQLPMIFEVPKT